MDRCHARPFMGRSSCASLPLLLALVLSSCGQQDPAFREYAVDNATGSSDAQASKRVGDGGAGTSGEGAIDPALIAAALEKDSKRGTIEDLASRSGSAVGSGAETLGSLASTGGAGTSSGSAGSTGASGGLDVPPSTVPPSTRDNVATDVSGTSKDSTFGSEGTLPLNWRTVELIQGGPGMVDILWVVDTSGSMAEEQAYLATNFNSLIGSLKAAGQDFQTAITTTDICQDQVPDDLAQRVCPLPYGGSAATHLRGSFVGDVGRKVLKSSDIDLVERFNSYTRLGVNGSGFEHGLKAAELAVGKSLAGQNEGLIRRDAFLAVIVVSDEQDDGIGLSQIDAYSGKNLVAEGLTTFRYTEDDLVSSLRQSKGIGNFSVSAITPTRLASGALCSAAHTQPLEEGTQYIAAAQKTGGIVQSICDTNWSQSLALIGADLSAQTSQVVLPSTPDPATIKVKVNGIESKAWTYVPANNAVKFNVGSVPPKGASIVVGYVVR